MTLEAYLAGSDKASNVRVGGFSLTERADGSQGFGSITFDDEFKELSVRGWMKVVVKETACITASVIFSGYIGPRRYSRSNGSTTYKANGSRFIDCTLVDENVVLDIRLFTGNDAKRPAETHADRINWMLTDGAMVGLIEDTSLVNLTSPRPFDEADYKYLYPSNLLEDIASALGRTYFVYVDGATGDRGLFFDWPDATVGDCTLSISNDLADITLDANGDVTGDVYPPLIDAAQDMDPSEVYAKWVLTYRNGTVTENSTINETTFFDDSGIGYRGIHTESTRVGLESTARAFADRYLVAHGSEKDTITCAVIVPKEKAGLIRAGQRIQCKFTHLDGTEDWTWLRITERQIAQVDGTNERYIIVLELHNRGNAATGPSGGAPGPDEFPHQPPGPPAIVQQVSGQGTAGLTLPSPISAGNTLIAALAERGGISWPYASEGWTAGPDGSSLNGGSDGVVIVYKHTTGTEGQSLTGGVPVHMSGTLYEVSGTVTPGAHNEATGTGFTLSSGSITALTGFTVGIGAQGVGGGYDSVAAGVHYSVGSGWTEDHDNQTVGGGHPTVVVGHRFDAGTYAFEATNELPSGDAWIGQVVNFVADSTAEEPPLPGQTVPWTVVTVTPGSTTSTGTTQFPYADGSLQVKVDGVLISPASYDETDPATGAFTLLWVIDSDEVVSVQCLGR